MGKKTAEPKSIVIDENDEDMKGTLRLIGGSRSDHWNNIPANQTINALWLKHSDEETRHRQCSATVAALAGIGPKEEAEMQPLPRRRPRPN